MSRTEEVSESGVHHYEKIWRTANSLARVECFMFAKVATEAKLLTYKTASGWPVVASKKEVDAHAAASASNMTGNMHSNSRWQRVSEAVRFSNLNSAPSQSYRQKQEDALGMFLRKNKAECASQAISRRGMLKTCIISPTAPNESPEKPRCARTQSP